MDHFTRRETVILTRTSSRRLAYLAKTGVVVPVCLRNDQRHQLYYSWEQVLELRTIQALRRQISLQAIRKILAFLENQGGDRALHNKHLVVDDHEIDWIRAGKGNLPQVVQVVDRDNRHVGQLKLAPLAATTSPSSRELKTPKVIDLGRFRQRLL